MSPSLRSPGRVVSGTGSGAGPRPGPSSASTWSSAARPRLSSSPTPTSRGRRRRCEPPASGMPARTAAPPAACWSTSPWPRSSPSCLVQEVGTLVVGDPGRRGRRRDRSHDFAAALRPRERIASQRGRGRGPAGGRRRLGAWRAPATSSNPTVIGDVPAGARLLPRGDLRPGRHRRVLQPRRKRPSPAPTRAPTAFPPRYGPRIRACSLSVPKQLDFGTVWVNSHLVLAYEVPWGGFKGSGYGRDLSLYALDDYSRTKHVMINHGA